MTWFYHRIRGGPIFCTGFSILSAKGFLGPHPPNPKSFQGANKTRPLNTMMPFIFTAVLVYGYLKNIELHCNVTIISYEVQ